MTKSPPLEVRLPEKVLSFQCSSENSPVHCTSRHIAPPVAVDAVPVAAPVSGHPEVLSLLESLLDAVNELEQRRAASLGELQEVAIELAVTIASELTGRAIQQGDYDVSRLTTRLLHELPLTAPSVLFVHPDDLSQLPTLREMAVPLELRPAPDVGRGNCRLEDESGRLVVSDIKRRLDVIRQDWLEELNNAQIERRQVEEASRSMQRFPDRRGTA